MDKKINESPFKKSRVPVLRVLKGFFNLKNKIMKTPQELIGRKVRGFKFESLRISYSELMDEYIGKIGEVVRINKNNNCLIRFEDNSYYYPADQIQAHLVEYEIPTLSDGVMMLVSDDKETWLKRMVFGKKEDLYFGYIQDSFYPNSWKYAKPIGPSKEEQLTAILGSSEKVNEIMELFKKD